MKIQILGTGCSKCNQLLENTRAAIKNLGLDYPVEKIEDIEKIVSMGVMMTPALAIDGKVVSSGRVLASKEIEKYLKD